MSVVLGGAVGFETDVGHEIGFLERIREFLCASRYSSRFPGGFIADASGYPTAFGVFGDVEVATVGFDAFVGPVDQLGQALNGIFFDRVGLNILFLVVLEVGNDLVPPDVEATNVPTDASPPGAISSRRSTMTGKSSSEISTQLSEMPTAGTTTVSAIVVGAASGSTTSIAMSASDRSRIESRSDILVWLIPAIGQMGFRTRHGRNYRSRTSRNGSCMPAGPTW